MARTRKTEPDIVVSAAAAAPARRKAAIAPRKARPIGTAPAVTVESVPAETAEFVAVRYSPTNEEIAALAYSYWVGRSHRDGCPEEDWLRAEQELLQRAV